MTGTITKISSYALLGTIISANATSPAQANSLKNLMPDDVFKKTSHQQESLGNENTVASIDMSDKAHSCISVPELDLCNQFKNEDDVKSINDSLLRNAKSSIDLIRSAEAIKVKVSDNVVHYIYNTEFTKSEMEVARKNKLFYANTYTNVWKQPETPVKKRVPEPSMLLGLIALCLLGARYQSANKNN